jgi:hypothetical protein
MYSSVLSDPSGRICRTVGLQIRRVRPPARAAEREPAVPGHAKFIFCDQSIVRTFSWIDHNRRMSKDYERLPESGEAFIYIAMSRLMVRRLVRS